MDLPTTAMLQILLTDNSDALTDVWRRLDSAEWLDLLSRTPTPTSGSDDDPECWKDDDGTDQSSDHSPLTEVEVPLLVAFVVGAEQCCDFLLDTIFEKELVSIVDKGLNVLHALVVGVHSQMKDEAVYIRLFRRLHRRVSSATFQLLREASCDIGLRPVELATYLGAYRLTEVMLEESGDLILTQSYVKGVHQYKTYDVGVYNPQTDESRFIVSPVCLLIANTSLEDMHKLKQSGVFRENTLLRAWVETLETTSSGFGYMFPLCMCLLSLLMAMYGGSYSLEYMSRCCDAEAKTKNMNGKFKEYKFKAASMMGFITLSAICWMSSDMHVLILIAKKLQELKINVKHVQRKLFLICLKSIGLAIFQFLCSGGLMSMILTCELWCHNRIGVRVHSYLTMLLIFSYTVLPIYLMTFQPLTMRFLTNFFHTFRQFLVFLTVYSFLMVLFGRLFSLSNIIAPSHNDTLVKSTPLDVFNGVDEWTYTAFRVTLNIMDVPRSEMSLPFQIVHVLCVFLLPFMFFNYIIGVVTSELSQRLEVGNEVNAVNKVILFVWVEVYLIAMRRSLQQITKCAFRKKIVVVDMQSILCLEQIAHEALNNH